MANLQLQDMLDELRPKITTLAYIHLRKMHRPSPYSIADLLSEANGVVIEKMNGCQYNENGGAALSTYILTGVRFHFINLVKKSYKMNYDPKIANNRKLNRLKRDLSFHTTHPESDSVNLVHELVAGLSERELKYMSLVIFPPAHITNRKKIRGSIRADLGMDAHEELAIRKKIKALLVETK